MMVKEYVPSTVIMRWTFPLLFTSLIILTKSSALYQNVDTTLEKKCNYLKSKTTSSYVGNSCFVTTTEKYATTLENWHKLHEHCKALAGYSGRMAFIRTREQIDALLKDRVIELHGRYYIGAKQEPPSNCGHRLCKHRDPEHHKNWYYIDANGRKQGELANLWLNNEPNNAGERPPENIVTLEQLQSSKLGFNDGNGQAEEFPILCEYEDLLQCKDNYTLIGKKCYKIFNEPETPYDAGEICKSEGGYLPSIHNDRQNQHIANMARHAKNIDYSKKRGNLEQWGPFLIGLKYENGKWSWQDGSETDYYRWYAEEGGSSTVVHTPSIYKYVFLQTSTNANEGEAGFGYWSTNLKGTDKLPFICQKAPDIII